MGRRGPKPTPKSILKIRGSWRAGAGGAEPRFTPGAPSMPEHLSDAARAEWERIVPELEAAGVLTLADRAALAAYCVAWGRWIDAEQHIATEPAVQLDEKGRQVINRWFKVSNLALEQLRRFMVEFGLTPSSRARVTAMPPEPEENAFEQFMSKGKTKAKPRA